MEVQFTEVLNNCISFNRQTDHSDNDFHVTQGDLLQQPVPATFCSDLSQSVSRPLSTATCTWVKKSCLSVISGIKKRGERHVAMVSD